MKRRTALTAILSFFAPASTEPQNLAIPGWREKIEWYRHFYTAEPPKNAIDIHTEYPLSRLRLT